MLVYGRRVPVNELEARINAITTQNVRDVCSRHIYDRDIVISAVGKCERA